MLLRHKLTCFLLCSGFTVILCASPLMQEFANANRDFSSAVYQVTSFEKRGNFLVCPLSVMTVMALISLGSKGSTFTEICQGIRMPENPNIIANTFGELSPLIRGNEFYALTSANRLFVRNDFPINRTYQQLAENVFDAGISAVDFGRAAEAVQIINNWVEQRTNNKIHDLIAPDDITANTQLILANAMHFKGRWQKPFDPYDTLPQVFHSGDGSTKPVDMMQITDHFYYYENKQLDCKYLELAYEGGDVSMVLVLPNKKDGLPNLERRMTEVLRVQPLEKQFIKVSIPKFSIETTIKFKPILENLGIRKVFSRDADLSGIGATSSHISTVVQKTFINVTETGTEAAAATAALILERVGDGQAFGVNTFIADHPFLYSLVHTTTGILFIGRYNVPESTL